MKRDTSLSKKREEENTNMKDLASIILICRGTAGRPKIIDECG